MPYQGSRQGELYDPSGIVFTYKGKTQGLREWARSYQCKCSEPTLRRRLQRNWPITLAMQTPEGVLLKEARKSAYEAYYGHPKPRKTPRKSRRA